MIGMTANCHRMWIGLYVKNSVPWFHPRLWHSTSLSVPQVWRSLRWLQYLCNIQTDCLPSLSMVHTYIRTRHYYHPWQIDPSQHAGPITKGPLQQKDFSQKDPYVGVPSQSPPQVSDSLWYSYNIFSNFFWAGGTKPTFDVPESPRPYKTFVLENRCLEMIVIVKYRDNPNSHRLLFILNRYW